MSLIQRRKRPILVDVETIDKMLAAKRAETILETVEIQQSTVSKCLVTIRDYAISFLKNYWFHLIIIVGTLIFIRLRYKYYQKEKMEENIAQMKLKQEKENERTMRHRIKQEEKNRVKNKFLNALHYPNEKQMFLDDMTQGGSMVPPNIQTSFPNATQGSVYPVQSGQNPVHGYGMDKIGYIEPERIDVDTCLADKGLTSGVRPFYDASLPTSIGIMTRDGLGSGRGLEIPHNGDAYNRNFINPKLGKRSRFSEVIPSQMADTFAYI
jgi:hypothetical protein